MMLKKIINNVIECLYPDDIYCVACGKVIDWSRPYHLCDDCMKNIRWLKGRTCRCCGRMLSDNNPMDICYNCRENEHLFSRGYTCTEYGSHNRSMVYSLKYDAKPQIAKVIGEIMADRMLSEFSKTELSDMYDLLIPVPLAEDRYAERGYNQAELITRSFAYRTGLKYEGETVERVRKTSAMRGLTPDERRRNIRGSFGIVKGREKSVDGARCLVVDDIVTTGSTVDELARILYDKGAEKVDFISFAIGADVIKS